MLRLRFFAKGFSRSFSEFPNHYNIEKARIDLKLASAKNLDSFINDLDLSKTSHSMLAYTLTNVDTQKRKLESEVWKKLHKIRNEVEGNLDKLDSQGIVNFCEWYANPYRVAKGASLTKEKKKLLIDRINEYIINRSFDRKQILSIHENLAPQAFKIEELENEVEKIAMSKLNLEEISKILTGTGRLIYTSKKRIFFTCMERILQLNKEELDGRRLAKILDALAIKCPMSVQNCLSDFLKFIEDSLPRWEGNDLLSVIKFYENSNPFYWSTCQTALYRLNTLLSNDQPIHFIIELTSLLKKQAKALPIADKIILKGLQIIKEKLSKESIDSENIKKILRIIGQNIDYQTALTLAHQINSKTLYFQKRMEIFEKASWLYVNKEGNLFPLTDLISIEINYIRIKNLEYPEHRCKIDALFSISHTNNYELYGLQKMKDLLIDDLREWITLSGDNTKLFMNIVHNKEYSSKFCRAIKPLQATAFRSLKRLSKECNSLFFSILLYECDPEKWKDFVIENKNNFSFEDILRAIRFYQGPFEAIIFLLEEYKNKLAPRWIGAAMDRIVEVENVQVLNDFARILNKIDPHYLLNDAGIFSRINKFSYLLRNSDSSLLIDLFDGAFKLLKDLPIHSVLGNQNIRILSLVSQFGKLEPEIADSVLSNYSYVNDIDKIEMLTISSKSTDLELRKNIINNVFNKINEKLNFHLLPLIIREYWYHPNTEIDNYIIDALKKFVPLLGKNSVWIMADVISKLSQVNINDHLELYNAISSLLKELALNNVGKLSYPDCDKLLDLAHNNIPMDLNFAQIISENSRNYKLLDKESKREHFIEKIKTIGLFDKNAVLAVCNKHDNFRTAYLAETISCLAELRFEKEAWANQMANELIDYVEDKKISFENDKEHINWIYGLVAFKANKLETMRHIENSKYFDCELPTFKHFLLENHFSMDPDYEGVRFLNQEIHKYWQDFDYFKHFGIHKPLITLIESSFNKVNLEIQIGTFFDKSWVPFYIPSKKTALWPVTKSVLLYQSNKERGEFFMYRNQILRKIKDFKILSEEEVNSIGKIDMKQFLN
ncbi:unnamed protein product [Blepharisma stoltei]|uniref:Uncharacterized protein n=1 Tax=Blepharisma stoltei TaxID=1481888 RepID=A0AAU9JMB8_9CILI|nr:unnamed protein product [Blepharisma stoltei]